MKMFLFAAAVLAGAPAAVHAQTAYDINRANQAMQICASPMGSTIPECAQLRGIVGGGVPAAGIAGANAGVAAGLFGMAAQAYQASRQQAPAAPVANAFPAPGSSDYYVASANATQNATLAYQACVARAGPGNPAGVKGCIDQLQAASLGGGTAGFPGGPSAQVVSPLASAAASAFSALGR